MQLDTYGQLEFEKDLIHYESIPILIKDKTFAIKLYSTLCNNVCYREDSEFYCSWRYAGGLVSYLRRCSLDCNETYLDFYMSGNEGFIFPDIEQILEEIGWKVKNS